MTWRLNSGRCRSATLTIASFAVAISIGCDDDDPARPRGFCWMGLDTLYTSGISISDTLDVQRAFEDYIAFVDSSSAAFPYEKDWRYLAARPFNSWQGRFYWQVDHEAYSTSMDIRLSRRLTYVDEHGVVVWPYWCD